MRRYITYMKDICAKNNNNRTPLLFYFSLMSGLGLLDIRIQRLVFGSVQP